MNQYSTFILISRDGYIADEKGMIDFIDGLQIKGDGGYQDYYSNIDLIVYGSKTYNFIKKFNLAEWPYKNQAQFVLTSEPAKYPFQEDITFYNGTVESLDQQFTSKNVWVMGGANVINQYLKKDMLKKMIISHANVYLKKGTRLFAQKALENFQIIKKENFDDIENITYQLITKEI